MPKPKTTGRFATLTERIAIHDLMKQHITVFGEGACAYEKGWDDARICTELNVKPASVAHVRREMFGQLRAPAIPAGDLYARIAALENQVAYLFQSLGTEPPKNA